MLLDVEDVYWCVVFCVYVWFVVYVWWVEFWNVGVVGCVLDGFCLNFFKFVVVCCRFVIIG